MSNYKSQIGRDITCKSHSARTERVELYRICPSKLSKHELEDLYFTLLENNIELKRTVNEQQDKIKSLSTKVQRITTSQKNALCKETKDCCVATKAIIDEQKESITDLRTANERMAERIRLLNMRLCSAKQFLRRSPRALQSTSRCNRCSTVPTNSLKNSSMSALNTKRSEGNLKPEVSSQDLNKDVCLSTRSAERATQNDNKSKSNRACDENKCRTLMEELQQKILNLEQELSNTHKEYSNRISRLEGEVSEVHKENVLVRSERIASEHELQQRAAQTSDLVTNLRAAEADCSDLKMQLQIEKRRVAELETQLKAAELSNNVVKSIEDRFTSVYNSIGTPFHLLMNDANADQDVTKPPKSSEDSGYMEANKSQDLTDDKGLNKLNEELMKKISDLESKLDHLKVSTATEMLNNKGNSKSVVRGQNGLQVGIIDSNVETREHKFDDMKVQPQKDIISAGDILEPMVGTVSRLNVQHGQNNQETPEILKEAPSLDVPSTNKDSECADKYDGSSEKEKLQTAPKNNEISPSDAKPPMQMSHQDYKYQIQGPIPTEAEEKKSSNKQRSIEVKNKSTLQKPKKDTDQPNSNTSRTNTEKRHSKIGVKPINKNSENVKDYNMEFEKYAESKNFVQEVCKRREVSTDLVRNEERKNTGLDGNGFYKKSDAMIMTDTPAQAEQEAQVDENTQSEPCEGHTRKCPCRRRHRDVATFRSCSGTLRFKTTDTASTRVSNCNEELCATTKLIEDIQAAPQLENKERAGNRHRSCYVDPGTFSISPKVAKQSRVTSPDNTDYEISSMTDLPSEKDERSLRSPRSPGEEKPTTTYTDSYTTPATTDYGSLSEGELPAQSTVRRMSIGEKPRSNHAMPTNTTTTQKMEATLQAISEELERCKRLLTTQKPREVTALRTVM